MFKWFIVIGSIGAALSVALGAFGAHGLEGRLAERMMKNFQTGVQYQMYHSLGLVLVGLIAWKLQDSSLINAAGWGLLIGIILFSGSLYVLSLTGITKLGMITPFGGVAFIVGWILLVVAVMRAG
ncbi:MAG TPA: DUF423 domain-containing protein [Bacilli bacterium]|nr:DUF423 domain-containing protein [Bacilli bacterium]